MIRRLWRFRELVAAMTRVQFQLRFRQSFVGVLWAVLPPLLTLGVAAVVFGGVVKVNTGDTPYVVATMAALAPWTFFANSLMLGVPSLSSSVGLIQRVAFPRASIPLGMVGASIIDLAVSFAIFLIVAFAFGTGLPPSALWVPLLFLIEIALVSGSLLLASALNVFARDVRLAVPLIAQMMLLVTPVMYPLSSVPHRMRPFYLVNPMTGLVESFRRVLVYGQGPQLGLLVPSIIGAGLFLVVGTLYFSAKERVFADVI
jgi:lipopolysaccharide transport system permease protein